MFSDLHLLVVQILLASEFCLYMDHLDMVCQYCVHHAYKSLNNTNHIIRIRKLSIRFKKIKTCIRRILTTCAKINESPLDVISKSFFFSSIPCGSVITFELDRLISMKLKCNDKKLFIA